MSKRRRAPNCWRFQGDDRPKAPVARSVLRRVGQIANLTNVDNRRASVTDQEITWRCERVVTLEPDYARSGRQQDQQDFGATGVRATKASVETSARRVRQRRVQVRWVGKRGGRVRDAVQAWHCAARIVWLPTKCTG